METDETTEPRIKVTTLPPSPEQGGRRALFARTSGEPRERFSAWLARAPWRWPRPPQPGGRRPLFVILICTLLLATLSGALAVFGDGAPWRLGADLNGPLTSTTARGPAGHAGFSRPPVRHALTPVPLPTPSHAQLLARWNMLQGCQQRAPAPLPGVLTSARPASPTTPLPNEVALTFDDGPTPYSTPAILDALEKAHAPATFFVMGQYARQWPALIQREWADGFTIGLHTWDHPMMTRISPDAQRYQFAASFQAIRDAIGSKACLWFWRPPYGDLNGAVVNTAQSLGLTTITWDDDTVDWSRPGTDQIVATALAEARPGAIILMHDGPAQRTETAAAIPRILAGLKARGLTPVTVPQLLADCHTPGVSDPRLEKAAEPTPIPTPSLPGGPMSGY
jgi:peptidoglycan/xylan/chitin deacetylase (PgdA/CDA1 family)